MVHHAAFGAVLLDHPLGRPFELEPDGKVEEEGGKADQGQGQLGAGGGDGHGGEGPNNGTMPLDGDEAPGEGEIRGNQRGIVTKEVEIYERHGKSEIGVNRR